MKVRGRRECQECYTVWTYYETGSPACPECDSLHSVGLDEPTRHTDSPATLDLAPVRSAVGELSDRELADRAAETGRAYARKRGFIDGGDLRPLDDAYVAALVLAAVGSAYSRRTDPTDAEGVYLLDLVRSADDEPGAVLAPETVPAALEAAFGLALATSVGDYLPAVRTQLDEDPDRAAARVAGRLRDHRTRIEALDGAVEPSSAHALLAATRDLGRYLRTAEESALVTAGERLDGLEDGL